MCGRFANAQAIPQYRAAVRDELPDHREPTPAPDADDYRPSHNVAPQTRCPVVRRELSWERERRLQSLKTPTEEDQKFQLIIQTMKWGLIPRFHKKPPSYAEAYKTINARDDTILSPQRSIWDPLLPAQRCVVFVQGFYEWQKRGLPGDGEKVERLPHFVGMTEPGHGRTDKSGHGKRLMPLAGLYERVRFDGEDKPLYTFTIVTTASNEQLGFLHDRMPVILPTAQAISTWLGLDAKPRPESQVKKGEDVDDSWTLEVAKLLRPLKSELDCYKVPKEVGKVGNSDPSFILPVEERKDGLKAFFAKQQQPKPTPPEKLTSTDKSIGSSAAETTSIKKEEQHSTQDSDTLMPRSSSDTQALLAAQQAEDAAALAEAAARAEQEEQDRMLAARMQRDFERADHENPDQPGADMSRSESIVNVGESSGSEMSSNSKDEIRTREGATVSGKEVGDGFAVPEREEVLSDDEDEPRRVRKRASSTHDDIAAKRRRSDTFLSQEEEASSAQSAMSPSSRFSPDPFNPPLSPPRPKGGYSRHLSPASGGGIHVNPARGNNRAKPRFEPFPQAPPHTWKSSPKTQRGPIDKMLETQRSSAEKHRLHQPIASTDSSQSRANSTTISNKPPPPQEKHSKPPTAAKQANDIRSFFSPRKK